MCRLLTGYDHSIAVEKLAELHARSCTMMRKLGNSFKSAELREYMSSIFDNKNNKTKCQIFTPDHMVETMLDLAEYKTDLLGRKVLENSFGEGNILRGIVTRYIHDCLRNNIPRKEIATNLGKDIYGIELDSVLFDRCKNALNAIVAEFKLPPVIWNLHNVDALQWRTDLRFDLIIGNPPYIIYKEIDECSKQNIRKLFPTCSVGKFDYCYAFIECGVNLLNEYGKLVQLVPSNIYKNVFAHNLRNLLKKHMSVVLDYPAQKIFKGILTSTSIFLYDRNNNADYICYRNITEQQEMKIPKQQLGNKWMFAKREEVDTAKIRFGDVFNASIVIATLLNEAFIVNKDTALRCAIEPAVLKKAVSPRALRYQRDEFIIFPYRYNADKQLVRFDTADFEKNFPGACEHLRQYAEKLDLRKKDKSNRWFEYGRNQALAHLNQKKILLSTVVTHQVELYELNEDTIPYSGIYVTEKSETGFSLMDAKRILQSDAFMDYVKRVGISVSGKSIRITCRDISDFKLEGDNAIGSAKVHR